MSTSPSIDIFCKVVDNYGDIGVCWRLARQLAARSDCAAVRLWVDDFDSFARIAPEVDPASRWQTLGKITLIRWDATLGDPPDVREAPAQASVPASAAVCLPAEALVPADIVIEAFACTPPAPYLSRMSHRQIWINLEYLSAESWVESCHGLPSMQAGGLRKFFFFPGFTEATGGLLREPDLLARRDTWQTAPHARLSLLKSLGVSDEWLQRLQAGARLAYVFCYPEAPLTALLQALAAAESDTLVLMANGVGREALSAWTGEHAHNVAVHVHKFVDQDTFDQLLWSSDLNFVRGEDSFVRAIWAGRPMIWQPYLQEDALHLEKLAAWLALSPYPAEVKRAMLAWNRQNGPEFAAAVVPLLAPEAFSRWRKEAQGWSRHLARHADLATQLLTFCAKQSQTS